MKTTSNFLFLRGRKSIVLLLFLFIISAVVAVSCKKDKNTTPNTETFKATLNGASEVPPNSSTATGTATLTLNKDTKKFTVHVTYSGMTATAAHIHKGAAGVSGDIIFTFPNPGTTTIDYTSDVLLATQITDLEANNYYINIHSTAFPNGEIRGQLIKQGSTTSTMPY